ncbi:MAG: site-2 protease family protein [Candidatus Dojkabacteria bacterium]
MDGIKLGKVFGIEIWLHYTWFFIFLLVVTSYSFDILPRVLQQFSAISYLLIGLVITLLFFGSILFHELAHSLYARKKGLYVRRITLFIFGGAAEIESEPKKPVTEFVMAGVGPLASIALAVVFFSIALIGLVTGSVTLQVIGSTLAVTNFILAIFNLIPGFPMDGGRMVRAALWKLTGNFQQATRIASFLGKVTAALIIVFGIIRVVMGVGIGGFWLILIGIFLFGAASAANRERRLNPEV